MVRILEARGSGSSRILLVEHLSLIPTAFQKEILTQCFSAESRKTSTFHVSLQQPSSLRWGNKELS